MRLFLKAKSLLHDVQIPSAATLVVLLLIGFWPLRTHGRTIAATSVKEFVAALIDPATDVVVQLGSMVWQDSDWEGYILPIPLLRNVTISGNGTVESPDTWPLLDTNYLTSKIRLGNGVTLTLRGLVLRRFRRGNLSLAPGCDFLASCLPEDRGILAAQNVLLIRGLCYPASMQPLVHAMSTRPLSMPGNQTYRGFVPQTGCVDASSPGAEDVPLQRQCWPHRGSYDDMGMYGMNVDANQKQLQTGYVLRLLSVEYVCQDMLAVECITQFGTVGCYESVLEGKLPPSALRPPLPQVAAPDASVDNGTGPSTADSDVLLGAIAAGTVGGVMLLGAIAAGVVLLECRQRRSQQLSELPQRQHTSGGGGQKAGDGASPTLKESSSHAVDVDTCDTLSAQGTGANCSMTTCDHLLADGSSSNSGASASDGYGNRNPSHKVPAVLPSLDPYMVVTPLTPPRPDVRLDIDPSDEVKLLPRTLGKGSYGRVAEGEYQGQRVAVKVLTDCTLEGWGLGAAGGSEGCEDTRRRCFIDSLAQEVQVLGRCQHPNVVRLLAACLTPPRVCLVMELMDCSLDRLMYSKPGELLPLHLVLDIALDVARGLEYLHPTIVHRDLKPGNVLISLQTGSRVVAKLSDFGLARLRFATVATKTPEAGTPAYMAPELFDVANNSISHHADVYSFGVLLWVMLTGQNPWEGQQAVRVAYRVTIHGERPPLGCIADDRRPSKLLRLLSLCWDQEPQRRPAAAEIVKHIILVQEQVARGLG